MTRLPDRALEKLLRVGAEPVEDQERPAELAGVDLGRMRVVREVGRGGMGVVYEAIDTQLGRRLALKVVTARGRLDEQLPARFAREASAAARLQHPNIAAVYDATDDYIAMQFVDGCTLDAVPSDRVKLLATLVRHAAEAVHFAHAHGIVHRDVKPSNLMVEQLDGDARVFVMDFGLAKEIAVDSSLSASGRLLGTPAFMAPEQASGGPVGPASDVYGLGATLYACLAGEAPFASDDVVVTLRRITEDNPRPLRSVAPVDRDLDTIVGKCLEKEPARRYGTARELAEDLDRWLRGDAIRARPPSIGYRLHKFARRHRAILRTAIVVAAVAVLVAVPLLWQARTQRLAAQSALVFAGSIERVLADAVTLFRSGEVGRRRERLDEGIEACRAFLESTDVPRVHYFHARLLRAALRPVEAWREAGVALAMDPELLEARFERALALSDFELQPSSIDELPYGHRLRDASARRDQIVADLEAVLAEPSRMSSTDRAYGRGRLFQLEGDLTSAKQEYERILELDPAHFQAVFALADIATVENDLERMTELSSRGLDLLRGYAPVVVMQARAEEFSKSILTGWISIPHVLAPVYRFASAGEVGSSSALAAAERGLDRIRLAGEAMGRRAWRDAVAEWDAAVERFDVVLRLHPDSAEARHNRTVAKLGGDAARRLAQ